MSDAHVGIIGGTGLGDRLVNDVGGRTVEMDTPYGSPSSPPVLANWGGVDIAFIARHGAGHRLNPTQVPYRANIWAMKKLGVSAIIASGATGSLREDVAPGHLMLCDQVIDKTLHRPSTFFDEGLAVHTEFAEPFCAKLRSLLTQASESVETTVHPSGTYVCMEGPQFSSRAESNMHRQWGGDLIGMTCLPEAKLAREAEICYALVALPTDYDCWRPVDSARGGDDLLKEILGNLKRATDNAVELIHRALQLMNGPPLACRCHDALRLAIWSDKSQIDQATKERYRVLAGRYFD